MVLMACSFEINAKSIQRAIFCLLPGLFSAFYLILLQDARKRLGSLFGAPLLLMIPLLLGEPVWPQAWLRLITSMWANQVIGMGLLSIRCVIFAVDHWPVAG